MKTILITGGTGLLGRAVTRRLAADHHVRVLSRSQSAAHFIQLPVPGRQSAAFRAGANLVPDNRAGGLTRRRYLDRHGPATT